jgi:hypothetical protein
MIMTEDEGNPTENDLLQERLDDIEALQARLDAIEMIKVSAGCGGGCFDPTLLNMYYGRQERECLLIMSLIRVATHMALKYKVDLDRLRAYQLKTMGAELGLDSS